MSAHEEAPLSVDTRARQQRILLDAERALRDGAIEEAASQFFQLSDQRDQLREQIAELEALMAAPISQLIELGEPQRRIAQLLELTAEEIRRSLAVKKAKRGDASDDGESNMLDVDSSASGAVPAVTPAVGLRRGAGQAARLPDGPRGHFQLQ